MQPFPDFNVIKQIDRDVAQFQQHRAQRRADTGNLVPARFRIMRLIARFTPIRQPETSPVSTARDD